jgi:hypothetical protein
MRASHLEFACRFFLQIFCKSEPDFTSEMRYGQFNIFGACEENFLDGLPPIFRMKDAVKDWLANHAAMWVLWRADRRQKVFGSLAAEISTGRTQEMQKSVSG